MGAPSAPAQPPVNPQFAVFQAQNPRAIGQVIHSLTVDIASNPSFSGESRDVTVEQFRKDFGLANDLVKKLHPRQHTQKAEIQRAFRQEFRTTQFTAGLNQRVANLQTSTLTGVVLFGHPRLTPRS